MCFRHMFIVFSVHLYPFFLVVHVTILCFASHPIRSGPTELARRASFNHLLSLRMYLPMSVLLETPHFDAQYLENQNNQTSDTNASNQVLDWMVKRELHQKRNESCSTYAFRMYPRNSASGSLILSVCSFLLTLRLGGQRHPKSPLSHPVGAGGRQIS